MENEPQHFIPPTLMGTVYWKDHVIAVIDDHGEAALAVEALTEAGFGADEARAWPGEFVTKNHDYYLQNRNLLQRLGSSIPSEEGEIEREIVAEAGKGHSVLTVRAPTPETVDLARDILRRYNAHTMKRYGPLTIEDL